MPRGRKPPPEPKPIRVYVSQLRPGDVVPAPDLADEDVTIVSTPARTAGANTVSMDVQQQTGVVKITRRVHERVRARRTADRPG